MTQNKQVMMIQVLLSMWLGLSCGGRKQDIEVGNASASGRQSATTQQNSSSSACLEHPDDSSCQGGGASNISGGNDARTLSGGWDALLEQARQQGLNLSDVLENYQESCDEGPKPPLKPIMGNRSDRPNDRHPDLNIWKRGMKFTGSVSLKTQDGPEDANAVRIYSFLSTGKGTLPKHGYRVYDWNWPSDAEQQARDGNGYKINDGSRGGLITGPNKDTTAVGFETTKGSAVQVPKRVGQYIIEDYIALVLFASPNTITLKYTREDHVATGYTVHIAGVCVNKKIVSEFLGNQASNSRLALKEGEVIGKALGSEIILMIRDTGSFMNPLDINHWWDD